MENHRNISQFILLGLSSDQNIQIFCFVLFLFCYISIFLGKLLILVSIWCSVLFHQTMYYFLSHYPTLTSAIPHVWHPNWSMTCSWERKPFLMVIACYRSFPCTSWELLQSPYLQSWPLTTVLPSARAPHHMIFMNRTRGKLLVLDAWTGGAVHSFSHLSMIISLPFCGPSEIDHYYCDIFSSLKVVCTDTYMTVSLWLPIQEWLP